MLDRGRRWFVLRILVLVGVTLPALSLAAPILTMTVTKPFASAVGGEALTFTGVITNRTGLPLEATDLFLSFSGFDFDVITPNQVLGEAAFTLPNNTFSADVELFTIDVALDAAAAVYGFQVLMQDLYGNFSDVTEINIDVTGVVAVPEPPIIGLISFALFALVIRRRRHHLV